MKKIAQSWITRQVAKLIGYGLSAMGGAELATAEQSNTNATATLVSGVIVIGAEMLWSWWQKKKLENQYP